jgi:hypothetical protein
MLDSCFGGLEVMKKAQSYLAILMIVACGLTNGISEVRQISTDPGSAGFYTVGGIRFSVPKGFRVLNKMSNADTSILSSKKSGIGLIVKRVESKLSEKDAALIGALIGFAEWRAPQNSFNVSLASSTVRVFNLT